MTEYRHASHYQLPTAEMPDTDVSGLLGTLLLGGDESCSHAVSADLRWRLHCCEFADHMPEELYVSGGLCGCYQL